MFALAQILPRRAERQHRHCRVATAAGLAVTADAHQNKSAALPEAPKLPGIAKADGKVVDVHLLAGCGNQRLTNPLTLARGMDGNARDAPGGERGRLRRPAMGSQRLRHQITAWTPVARPHRLAECRTQAALLHQPQRAADVLTRTGDGKMLPGGIHHAPQIQR